MAPHITAKLERDASMPRCRNLSAFFGKRCVADHKEDTPCLKPSPKQQRRRASCNKDGAFAVSASHRSIQKLLSDPIAKDHSSAQSFGCAVPLTQNEEEETLNSVSLCQESSSQLIKVSLDLSEQMELDSAQICKDKLRHSIYNDTREVTLKTMESSDLDKCKVTEGADRQLCMGEKTACSLELSDFQEQVIIQNVSNMKQESCLEQSKADCNAEVSKEHALEHSVKICIGHQLVQHCTEHQLSNLQDHSSQVGGRLEVECETLNTCQEICRNLEEPKSIVHATLLQGDGRNNGSAEICASEASAGAGQINTIASSVDEHKPGCLKDQEQEKLIKDVRRRSSRIKKLVKYNEVDINVSSMGTGSCMEEQEDPKSDVPNSVQKIRDNDSTLIQSDFFLPASKRTKKQKVAEEFCNGERKQKDKNLHQIQKGNSATNHEDFFVPASKKQKQMLNALDPMMKDEREENPSNFHFDLWTEARLAAEENAQLCVGKPTHPFFAQHKGGQRASLSSANAGSTHQAVYPEEMELFPSAPFHINQSTELTEAETGTTAMWSIGLSGNSKADQTSYRRECLDLSSKELDGLLRVPTVDKSGVIRRYHASQGTSLDHAFEPLLSFLKDSENVSKDLNMSEGEDIKFSLAYLKERLNLFCLERAKRCSHDSSIMMDSSSEEGSTSKNALWTNVYQPQSPKEVCGNRESVNRLTAWLERWQAAGAITTGFSEGDSAQRKKSNNEDSDKDGGCFQEDSSSEPGDSTENAALQNVLFLAGPVGCGKTAAIYACARAQGYTVIEVNCSDNRNGLLIKQKFSESMESHRVRKWSADTNGPGNASCTTQGDSTPTDLNVTTDSHVLESKNLQHVSKEKRQKQGKNHKRKDDIATTSKVPNRAAQNTDVKAKQLDEPIECDKSMTVLLFEDVDMVFEDDRGFMAAVTQVAATAKRPIILTSNDEKLCLPQGLGAELLEFTRPSTKELVVLAYLVCVAEGISCRPEFLLQMVKLCKQDLRLLLNYVQFWSQSHANEPSSEITDHEAIPEKEAATQSYLRSEEAESASVTTLFKHEAQHRLWPAFVFLSFPCQVTQSVACKLNDKVSQVDRKFMYDEEKKLEGHMVEKLALLKKSRRQKVDSPLEATAELAANLETPVKNVKEAKAVARSPILREKLKKDLALTMHAFTDDVESKGTEQQVVLQTLSKQDSSGNENRLEPLNIPISVTCDSNGAIPVIAASPNKNGKPADDTHVLVKECETCREAYTSTAEFKVESTPPRELTAEPNLSPFSSEDRPLSEIRSIPSGSVSQSIHLPIYALWSELRNTKEREGLNLSSASRESYAINVSLSKLSDYLSSSDVMSRVHGPGRMFLEDDSYCWESPEDCGMLQSCSTFAHRSFMLCVQECSTISNLPENQIRPVVSIEDMMVAVNDSCAVGKLFTVDEVVSTRGYQLQSVRASHQEQENERYRKKSSLQHALCSDLPAKAQVSFQGASFYDYASFLAKIGHLEQDRLAFGAARRRGRGFQNYFCTHPWNLSKESINFLEQFGRFGTS